MRVGKERADMGWKRGLRNRRGGKGKWVVCGILGMGRIQQCGGLMALVFGV